jgi:hypothetical protein
MFRRITLTAALLSSLAAPLYGQVQVGLSAFAGGFLPMGELFEELRLAGQRVANVSQEPGPAIGGRVTVWISRFAIDAEAGYTTAPRCSSGR